MGVIRVENRLREPRPTTTRSRRPRQGHRAWSDLAVGLAVARSCAYCSLPDGRLL